MSQRRLRAAAFCLVVSCVCAVCAETVTIGTGTTAQPYPMNTYGYHEVRNQAIYLASELGGSGRISSLAVFVSRAPGIALNSWTIRLKHTDLTSYAANSLEDAGWTLVYRADETVVNTGWHVCTFTTPFDYDGTSSLMVDFSFDNSTSEDLSTSGQCYATAQGGEKRSLTAVAMNDAYGDPLTWTGSTEPTVSADTLFFLRPNIQVVIDRTVIAPPEDPPQEVVVGTSVGNWEYPMNTLHCDSRIQAIYHADEIGRAGAIDSLWLSVNNVPPMTLQDWTIRMKYTDLDEFASASLDATGWVTVWRGRITVTQSGWQRFDFLSAFQYDGNKNLMVDFCLNNSFSDPAISRCAYAILGGNRSVAAVADDTYGDPLYWTGGTSPTATTSILAPLVKLGFLLPGEERTPFVDDFESPLLDSVLWPDSSNVTLSSSRCTSSFYSARLFDGGQLVSKTMNLLGNTGCTLSFDVSSYSTNMTSGDWIMVYFGNVGYENVVWDSRNSVDYTHPTYFRRWYIPISSSLLSSSCRFRIASNVSYPGTEASFYIDGVRLTVSPAKRDDDVIYRADMTSSPGWTLDSGWAWGAPGGRGDLVDDPMGAYTGTNVLGYVLGGGYASNIVGTRYATTSAIDCSGYEAVSLCFQRWLGVAASPGDNASIEVSNNGTTWTSLWANPTTSVRDIKWQALEYDISAVADGQSTVYVRWGLGPIDSSGGDPGWSLDDVELIGTATDTTGTETLIEDSFETSLNWTAWTDSTSSFWLRHTGGTSSPSTGPSGAYDGSYYAYVESSNPSSPSKKGTLSKTVDMTGCYSAELSFYYHMYGATMGTLAVQVTEGGHDHDPMEQDRAAADQ